MEIDELKAQLEKTSTYKEEEISVMLQQERARVIIIYNYFFVIYVNLDRSHSLHTISMVQHHMYVQMEPARSRCYWDCQMHLCMCHLMQVD